MATMNKYNEHSFLAEIQQFVDASYNKHYVGEDEIQTVDVWDTLGTADTTCRDTAIKYLMRYGKKKGRNKADLLKAIHYIMLLDHFANKKELRDAARMKNIVFLDENGKGVN